MIAQYSSSLSGKLCYIYDHTQLYEVLKSLSMFLRKCIETSSLK